MTIRNIFLLLCVIELFLTPAWAGPVSLDAGQVATLRELIKQNDEAAGLYRQQYKIAASALNDDPDPVRVLVGEGKLNSDPDKIKSDTALHDMQKANALAWVWLVGQDDRFAQKGSEFILAWARVNKPDGDPINETKLEPLIVAYDVLRPRFTPQDRALVDAWLENRANMLWNDPRHRTENWQSHRLKIVGMVATVTDDEQLWMAVEQGFKRQMSLSFLPGGASTDFGLRDAMHYHLYSVLPLVTLACVAHQRRHDWYNYQAPSGVSLRSAVEFVEPYALGKKTHVEFAHSKVSFDKVRAAAGEKEYSEHIWSSCESGPMFSEASCVDPGVRDIAVKVWCGVRHRQFVDWNSVLNSVRRGN
ncbi:alginate lyase family protein [Paraburkholderia dinghuensis]|uniref:Alginate lyase domain-containing protein n=1 Tax=Paraburkholderia dinghuensis TaxID=2305225 RepID=A0A3N6P7M7_9BURK|nr:alginate lyase family protein [Paraburkholderia dinghuensis]RQH10063.1 hypothetical protein D1Y85_02725 [Paraburkholderia dinghuensis]